jgi:hypothetical protein
MENKYAKYLTLAAAVLFLGSCSTFSPTPEEKQLLKTAEALDELTEYNEEFGTISMSALMLAKPDEGFYFDLNRSAATYFSEAKQIHQGDVAKFTQAAHYLELGLKAQNTLATKTLTTENTTQSDTNNQKTDEAKSFLAKDSEGNVTSGFGAFLTNSTPTLSNREAIAIAAGDKAVENIYRLLGSEEQAKKFKDKSVIFGAATVSVSPGWRTRKDFAATISADIRITYDVPARREVIERLICFNKLSNNLRRALSKSYKITPECLKEDSQVSFENFQQIPAEFACTIEDPDKRELCSSDDPYEVNFPMVIAVSPMTETQALGLTNSSRQIAELSLALAGILREMGGEATAQVFDQYVKSVQKDSKIMSLNSVSNAFSHGGGIFGYRIGPKFKSLDLQDDDDEFGNILEAQSFPIFILMGTDEGYLYPKIMDCGQFPDDVNKPSACKNHKLNLIVYEPVLNIIQSAHWSPITDHWYSLGGWFNHRSSEEELIQRLLEAHNENIETHNIKDLDNKKDLTNKSLKRLKEKLESKVLIQESHQVSTLDQTFPIDLIIPPIQSKSAEKVEVQISEIAPERIRVVKGTPETVQLVITGEHLEEINWIKVAVMPDNTDVAQLAERPKNKDNGNVTNYLLNLKVNAKASGGIAFKLPRKEKDKPSLMTQPINIEVVEAKNELGDIKKDITDLKKEVGDLKKNAEAKKQN